MTMITIQDKLEFNKREGSPLVQKDKILVQKFLFEDKTQVSRVTFKENEYATFDSFFNVPVPTYSGIYYDVESISGYDATFITDHPLFANKYLFVMISLSEEKAVHER
jgi:hypothetical protein